MIFADTSMVTEMPIINTLIFLGTLTMFEYLIYSRLPTANVFLLLFLCFVKKEVVIKNIFFHTTNRLGKLKKYIS